MRFGSLFVTPSVLSLAWAAPTFISPAVTADYDAIVVGGGPAGLSALSALARVRRNALLIDSGEYRNDVTRHMHDVIGFDGVSPAYYRFAARQLISDYSTVSMSNGTVTKIQPEANNTYFTVTSTYPGKKTVTFTARKVILATGLRDILPATPGLSENWGKGIYWCPWCDGHEHADQPLGIIGSILSAASTFREVVTLNKDVIAFVNGTDTPENRAATEKKFPKWEKYLELHNVKIENRTIKSITRIQNGTTGNEDPSLASHPEHDLFEVGFDNKPSVLRAAFLTNFADEQKSKLGEQSGVALYGGRLAADNSQGLATNIPGIYAIGDANSDNVTNVPHALFSGKRTGVFLHVKLERENSDAELASPSKRSLDEEARSIWARVNGKPGDLFYAGEFDQ